MTSQGRADVPDQVLDEAIMWVVRLQSGYADEHARHACLQWRQRDPLHEVAWQALQHNESTFQRLASLPGVPSTVTRQTLDRMQRTRLDRRRLLQIMGTGLVVGAMGWQGQAPIVRWAADYSTGVGQRRTVVLADGTRLQLNTDSAVDVLFTHEQRQIKLLRGEIFIDTGPDHHHPGGRRSFWVQTAQARLQALGTAFAVRQATSSTSLSVEENTVLIHQAGGQQAVVAGEQYSISADASHRVLASAMDASAWTRGQLVARSMPMQVLLAELSRYQRGWLGCDRQIAALEVSGVFQLNDIDRALDALGDSLPVRVERFTPFWRRVVAR